MKKRVTAYAALAAMMLAACLWALPGVVLADPAGGEGTGSGSGVDNGQTDNGESGTSQPGTPGAPGTGEGTGNGGESGQPATPGEGDGDGAGSGNGNGSGTGTGAGQQPGDGNGGSGSGTVSPGGTSGEDDTQGQPVSHLRPQDAPGADGNGTDPTKPTKPYETLTPVEGDNTVNTHQLPDSSFLYDTSLSDLAGADFTYDGQTVQITGEAIGDIIRADADHVWVTLASTSPNSDDTVAVFMTKAQASIIDTLGEYGATGTVLQVRGVFHLVCKDHEGASDIHVENVNVVSPGHTETTPFRLADFGAGLVVCALGGILTLGFYLLRRRMS